MEVLHYLTVNGVDPLQSWLDDLKDLKGRVAVLRRVDRLASGNFGDHQFCGNGVWELRIDFGPGYRVYYALRDKKLVLLLIGGTKRTQASDIKTAINYWIDYQKRLSNDSETKTPGLPKPR